MSEATPNTPQVIYDPKNNNSLVKVADPQYIVVGDEQVSIDIMSNIIFEEIGSQEIINIDRNDTVFGSSLLHEGIQNNNRILQNYNSYTMAPVSGTSYEYFKNFTIDLGKKVPEVGNGLNGENVYIDSSTGNLVIEFVNIESDEQIEVNILISGTGYYDTI